MFRAPSLACACATALRNSIPVAGGGERAAAAEERGVDARDAVYMLNPSGDLPHTQDTFQDFFLRQTGWQVNKLLIYLDQYAGKIVQRAAWRSQSCYRESHHSKQGYLSVTIGETLLQKSQNTDILKQYPQRTMH